MSPQLIILKRLTAIAFSLFALAILVGCPAKPSDESAANKTDSAAKTTVAPKPAPEIEPEEETEKTPEPKPSLVNRTPDLPPLPPTSQEVAAEEVTKRGGKVEFNKNRDVVKVDWAGAEITNNDLVLLQGFEFLRELDLTGTPITDEGLKHLKPLNWLRHLYLLNVPITDEGVAELVGHSRLDRLCLDGTKVTDKGVAKLVPLSRLVMLHLATQGEITDACIDSLVQLKELRELKLEGTKVTEDGKARLTKALPELKYVGQLEEGIPID